VSTASGIAELSGQQLELTPPHNFTFSVIISCLIYPKLHVMYVQLSTVGFCLKTIEENHIDLVLFWYTFGLTGMGLDPCSDVIRHDCNRCFYQRGPVC
jgi:hypothetical protein